MYLGMMMITVAHGSMESMKEKEPSKEVAG